MKTFLWLSVLAAALYAGFFSDSADKYWAESQAERAAQAKHDAIPVIVREIDGCKVYRFTDGGYSRYFTRCATETTTEYRVPSGKTTRPESITTENINVK